MQWEFSAIVENGLLRPLEPIELSENQVVRVSLRTHAENVREAPPADSEPSAYDVFLAAGLLGCVKDAPPDLSTNPKYMEGFGEDPDSH
ncbi:MAG: antitoxin family protein [Pirellulales bacterium]|nr:antitoxin family protein [Pirellulales bacterium]